VLLSDKDFKALNLSFPGKLVGVMCAIAGAREMPRDNISRNSFARLVMKIALSFFQLAINAEPYGLWNIDADDSKRLQMM
jgi:hypothetical protein